MGNYIAYSQGQNNNYPIDEQDIVNIFRQQGIEIFKFPFKLKKGEFIDIWRKKIINPFIMNMIILMQTRFKIIWI